MRAVSEDKEAAELMGISVNKTITLTFAIGSALAAVAGVLLCSNFHALSPYTGSMPGIKAFVAAVFGGIGSIPGAMVGGILLGVIENLSKGYKQRVGIAQALVGNPDVLILDEPTVGLDIMVYQTLMDMLHDFAANGKTVFVTSHNIDLVSRVCNRVAIINNGVVAELIDFSKEPLKRRNLSKIFFNMYGQEEKKEK